MMRPEGLGLLLCIAGARSLPAGRGGSVKLTKLRDGRQASAFFHHERRAVSSSPPGAVGYHQWSQHQDRQHYLAELQASSSMSFYQQVAMWNPLRAIICACLMTIWLIITSGTGMLLWQVPAGFAWTRKALVFMYTISVLIVVPWTLAMLLPIVLLAFLVVIGFIGLSTFDSFIQSLGIFDALFQRFVSGTHAPKPASYANPDIETPSEEVPLCILIPCLISQELGSVPLTIQQFLPRNAGGRGIKLPPNSQILLVYNPEPKNAEELECVNHCALLGSQIEGAKYMAICAHESTSQVANYNAGLAFLAKRMVWPEILCCMDADMIAGDEDVFLRAHDRLSKAPPHVAAVAGRCGIHIGDWISATECQLKDIVTWPGRSCILGTGLLVGGCHFHRFKVVVRHGYVPGYYSSDVLLMMRFYAEGLVVWNNHDLAMITEAPPNIMSFVTQRVRWAQGLAQIAYGPLLSMIWNANLGGGVSFARRWLIKIRWTFFWYSCMMLPKYLVPLLLPCTLAWQLRCGMMQENDTQCQHLSYVYSIIDVLALVFTIVGFFSLVVASLYRHPWLRWYHFLSFCIVRPFYGIFIAQLPVVADAQHMLGLKKWIPPQRHKKDKSEFRKASKGEVANSLEEHAEPERPMVDLADSCGKPIWDSMWSFRRTS